MEAEGIEVTGWEVGYVRGRRKEIPIHPFSYSVRLQLRDLPLPLPQFLDRGPSGAVGAGVSPRRIGGGGGGSAGALKSERSRHRR